MNAAKSKTRPKSETRLMVVTQDQTRHLRFASLAEALTAGDVLVVNDASTLPSGFFGLHRRTSRRVEMRLAEPLSVASLDRPTQRWCAIFFGEGDWRTPTEHRPAAPELEVDDEIELEQGLVARVARAPSAARLAVVEMDASWGQLQRAGHPVQYSHLREDWQLWDAQTIFAGPPVALEPPSAAFPLTWGLVSELERRGVRVMTLTHAAGLSTLGSAELDALLLPLPERYWIPEPTAGEVNLALAEGRRVIALGTTVTRALESAAVRGEVAAGAGLATLKITAHYRRRVVSGVMTGFHESGASHLRLLGSFVDEATLASAYRDAEGRGYLAHEFGDSCLVISEMSPRDQWLSAQRALALL